MSLIQKILDELELYKISKKQKEFSLKKMEEAIKSNNQKSTLIPAVCGMSRRVNHGTCANTPR